MSTKAPPLFRVPNQLVTILHPFRQLFSAHFHRDKGLFLYTAFRAGSIKAADMTCVLRLRQPIKEGLVI
eukprot:1136233-Pelagomonas_calceolata.AAC.2